MTWARRTAAMAILATLGPWSQARADGAPAPVIAIVHALAMPVTTPPVADATIVIAGGHVRSVTAQGPIPPGARRIDAHGQIVTPALFSAATQLGLVEVSGARDTDDRTLSHGPLGPAFDVQYALNGQSNLLPLARADGLAWAMSYPGGTQIAPFAGQGALIHLRPSGDILARAGAAMVALTGDMALATAGGSRAAQWVLLRTALAEARRAPSPRDPASALILSPVDRAALAPVIAGTMPLLIAANRESDIRQAIRLARESAIRVAVLGGAEAWRAAAELAAAHVPVILDPEADLPQTFDSLGARLDNAAMLAKAGVEIAFSVPGNGIYLSYDAGLDLREGAGIAVANGLPYATALRAITAAPAAIWGMRGAGTLTPGAGADLVLWDGDPLEPASNPAMLFIDGHEVSLSTRQRTLRDRYAPTRAGTPPDNATLPPAYR
ncbi:amidohydrolase family protein [Gluconacetobacter aggeris]|uniref:Amidohydrolase family protein n=1 Tax=Gluconacetobacter aggeris TaxID=1286186 RepID=A0A7W4IQ60_9PROT|nr:amidohydrolase family protein [Gluconacetobacter aggeris]MBB2166943.1 amidohydrolase family protein [Gluconacetobacter aggeris]